MMMPPDEPPAGALWAADRSRARPLRRPPVQLILSKLRLACLGQIFTASTRVTASRGAARVHASSGRTHSDPTVTQVPYCHLTAQAATFP
eukprot:jgi/Tetstr1/459676/TSEL_005031.t1